jgi:hypothetical protein
VCQLSQTSFLCPFTAHLTRTRADPSHRAVCLSNSRSDSDSSYFSGLSILCPLGLTRVTLPCYIAEPLCTFPLSSSYDLCPSWSHLRGPTVLHHIYVMCTNNVRVCSGSARIVPAPTPIMRTLTHSRGKGLWRFCKNRTTWQWESQAYSFAW